MSRRIIACVLAAALAWFVGQALGLPAWSDTPGDKTDLAVLAATLVWVLTA